jgi:hypothetical protein
VLALCIPSRRWRASVGSRQAVTRNGIRCANTAGRSTPLPRGMDAR